MDYAGPDPDDRHVHAAAIACGADVLLTHDRGLASHATGPYIVLGCDAFFTALDDVTPSAVRAVTLQQARYWSTRPGTTARELGASLRASGCPHFAARVDTHLAALDTAHRSR